MQLTDPKIKAFALWIARCGGEVLTPISDYEILRVVINGGTHSAYKRRTGRQTWPETLVELYRQYRHGGYTPRLALAQRGLSGNRKGRLVKLAERDGWRCWYCDCAIQPLGYADIPGAAPGSVEEVCPRQIGGPVHIGNQVIACKSCNNKAANLPVVEKVKMRDRLRRASMAGPTSQRSSDAPLCKTAAPLREQPFEETGSDDAVMDREMI